MKNNIYKLVIAIILIGVILISYNYTQHAIDKCVKAGHEKEYCERGVN